MAWVSEMNLFGNGMSEETSEYCDNDDFCAFITKNVNLVDDARVDAFFAHQYCEPASDYDGEFCALIDKHICFVDDARSDPFSHEDGK